MVWEERYSYVPGRLNGRCAGQTTKKQIVTLAGRPAMAGFVNGQRVGGESRVTNLSWF